MDPWSGNRSAFRPAFGTHRRPLYNVHRRHDATVIEVDDDLDLERSGSLGTAIGIAAAATELPIFVTLATCRYCDASGLRVLLMAKAKLGRRLRVVVPRGGAVRRIFDVTNTTDRLDLQEAVS